MSDIRQQPIDMIDALTPEQQQRALRLLRSLSSGETEVASEQGDGAMSQPPAAESSAENEDGAELSQEKIDRRMAALDEFIGGVAHGSLAQNIDEELYGK